MLNPQLASVGYGSYCEDNVCAAAINVQSNATSPNLQFRRSIMSGGPLTGESEARGGGWGNRYNRTIAFPADGSTIDLLSLNNEWPDPSKGCHFSQPVGLPITLQLGWYLTPRITGGSLTENGKPVEACSFDALSYRNPDELTQKIGRAGLEYASAVVIVPRLPLTSGARYEVHAVVDNVVYQWAFSTSAKVQGQAVH